MVEESTKEGERGEEDCESANRLAAAVQERERRHEQRDHGKAAGVDHRIQEVNVGLTKVNDPVDPSAEDEHSTSDSVEKVKLGTEVSEHRSEALEPANLFVAFTDDRDEAVLGREEEDGGNLRDSGVCQISKGPRIIETGCLLTQCIPASSESEAVAHIPSEKGHTGRWELSMRLPAWRNRNSRMIVW